MFAIKITKKNHKKEVQKCKTPVLLCFSAVGGFSSLLYKQTANHLSRELLGKIKIGVVENVPDNAAIFNKYDVRFLPSAVFVRGGEITDRIVGNLTTNDFLMILNN